MKRCTVLLCLGLAACTVNPVTGARQLALVSTADEIAIGQTQYLPSRQMQGGDYVVDPALTAYVAEVGARIAAASDRPLPYEFVVLNNSVPNAWALPGGKIAVNRGLLTELGSEAELAAVLGHEVVHAAARHGAQAMQRGLLLQGALVVAGVAAERNGYSNLVVGAASVGAQLLNQRYGREAELESDLHGMRYMSAAGYDPAAAIDLQQTFVRLSEGREASWLEGLFASHPPSSERVERNRATAATLPATGELGRDRYLAATADLRAALPAYAAYDRGRAALAEGRLDAAEAAALEAVAGLPGESHFHSLLGDIDMARNRDADALAHYDDAIARYDGFFYPHLRKGLVQQRLGRDQAAEVSLQTSIALLPTADAYYALGTLAERRRDRNQALAHYEQAAGANTPAGAAARDAAVRLDLPTNPGKYVSVRTGLDADGTLLIELVNDTQLVVTNIVLAIRYAEGGALRELRRTWPQALAAGAAQRLDTGIGPLTANGYQVAVLSARVQDRN